jgi:pyrimidine-nucleoside phosphorylase
MRTIIEAQGGNASVLDDPAVLPQAGVRRAVEAERSGRVLALDTRAIGLAAMALGAGRRRLEDVVRPGVGFHITVKPGDAVRAGDRIATVYADSVADAETAMRSVRDAVRIGDGEANALPLIAGRIEGDTVAPQST